MLSYKHNNIKSLTPIDFTFTKVKMKRYKGDSHDPSVRMGWSSGISMSSMRFLDAWIGVADVRVICIGYDSK